MPPPAMPMGMDSSAVAAEVVGLAAVGVLVRVAAGPLGSAAPELLTDLPAVDTDRAR